MLLADPQGVFMKITQQDIEDIEIAWDHFQTDLEHWADCEIFDEHATIEALSRKQCEPISKGRTRGAGVFNRDVDNIHHQINLIKIEINDLNDYE